MIRGYLVCSKRVPSISETDLYMNIRKEIGYSENYPELYVRIKDGVIWLKNTELGLIETKDEANLLKEKLDKDLPNYNWDICEKKYHNSDKIEWHKINE